jgi:hypothetical protein
MSVLHTPQLATLPTPEAALEVPNTVCFERHVDF